MIRIQNDLFGMMMHASLHNRMVQFAKDYSPEQPAEAIVTAWLNMVYTNDPHIHILINCDDKYLIYEHCVIQVIETFGSRLIVCHQAQHDRPNSTTFDEGAEYIKKLVVATNAASAIVFMSRGIKAMEKRHGFKNTRSVLVWTPAEEAEEET